MLGHMGNAAAVTPVLDRAVQTDFVSFRNAFCQNPVCTPSRCSFMTGWYPHVRGHRTMYHMLREGEPVLLRTLKEEGYDVWWGGKNDLVPAENGYEKFCTTKYQPPVTPSKMWGTDDAWRGPKDGDSFYSFFVGKIPTPGEMAYYPDGDWANVHGAVEKIRNHDPDRPLCVYLPLTYPHPPYAVEDPWFSAIDRSALPPRIAAPRDWNGLPGMLKGIHERQNMQTWSEDRWAELRATYYGMCARVDHQFGLILQALRDSGMYDDTLVFFFSDHGDFTGDYGLVEKTQNTFEDCLTRVPLLVKPNLRHPIRPRVSDAMVELIDISATVEAACEIEPGHTHFGRSLLPVVSGVTETHRDSVFCEGGRLANEEHCKELQSRRHGGGDGMYWPRLSLQWEDGPEHSKATMCRTDRFKYVNRLYENDELYDLRSDPAELNNRIDDPAMADVLSEMKTRMLNWYVETSDVVPFDSNMR